MATAAALCRIYADRRDDLGPLSSGLEPRRNPVRAAAAAVSSYTVPDERSFYFCEQCDRDYEYDCPEHGVAATLVPDSVAPPPGTKGRAKFTLPPGLEIRRSTVPAAGRGVFAVRAFSVGVSFGPYQGKVVHSEEEASASGCAWQVRARRLFFVTYEKCIIEETLGGSQTVWHSAKFPHNTSHTRAYRTTRAIDRT